jgi:hypothetical protein
VSIDHGDIRGLDPERRKGRRQVSIVDQEVRPRSQDQWSSLIAGSEGDRDLKFLEWAATETTVLQKGHTSTDSELRGEKRCDLKPLLATLQSCVT